MSLNIDNIVHPNEAFLDYKDKLLSIYVEDYGEKERELIKNRMNNTLYLFDSNPVSMMEFLMDNSEDINDPLVIRQIEEEYINYVKVKSKIDKKLNKELLKYIASFFDISWRRAPMELLDLDYEAFSYESNSIMKNSSLDNLEERKGIEKRRADYLEECEKLGIKPLTNPVYINFILEQIYKYDSILNQRLLKGTKWGQRIVKRLMKYNPQFTIDKIDSMMMRNRVASTYYSINNGIRDGICMYYPLVENLERQALDNFMFHENRHVIESSSRVSGLSLYGDESLYRLINEIHTEDKAIKDGKKLKNEVLFDNSSLQEGCFSPYAALLLFTDGFYDEFNTYLNDFALHGRINEFEEMFGKDDLLAFEKYLECLECYIKKEKDEFSLYTSLDDREKAKQYVKKLKDNARRVK